MSFVDGLKKGAGLVVGACCGIVLLIVIIGIILGMMGGSSNNSTGSQQPEPPSDSSVSGSTPPPYKFGERFVVDEVAYTFNKTETTKELGSQILDNFYGEKADGIFILLEIKLENVGNKSKTVWSMNNIKIVDYQGREFEHDTSAEIYLSYLGDEYKSFSFDQLQPSLPTSGYVVFDIPENLNGHFVVESDDIFSSKKAVVTFS